MLTVTPQFRWWAPDKVDLPISEVIECYKNGMAGALPDVYATERMKATQFADGEKTASLFGLVGDGKGKLSLPYLPSWRRYPKCWPCPGQTTGDCVSHAGKNSGLVLIGVEADLGQPDPETGSVEGFPDVTPEAEAQGVVACENIYRARGHSGQGASCERLIEYVTQTGGIMLRKNYPEIGVDLTRYDARLGIPGGSGVPQPWTAEGAKHRIRAAAGCSNWEVCRDYVASGFPLWACSGYGWSSSRDENGFSKRSGSWLHSWIVMGFDDRKETVDHYGFALFLYNHDWARWNGGGRDVRDSAQYVPAAIRDELIAKGIVNATTGNYLIPEGSFWADARLLDNCDVWAMSNLNGFPRRKIDTSFF